jgi:hypothetical protein
MRRSMLRRATLVILALVATIALTSKSSFSETSQCKTSPGAAAPSGMHWYYRLDRKNNRYCWYMQAAGLLVRSQGMPSNPKLDIARERISAPLQTDPTALSQRELAKADSTETNPTDTRQSPVYELTANFTGRWSDLPKSPDSDQDESTPRNSDTSEPAASDPTEPVASTTLVAADSKQELPHNSARAYFWSIFLAGALSMIFFGGVLKLTRWLYRFVAKWWTANDCAESSPSELVRALRRVDEAFNESQSSPRRLAPTFRSPMVCRDFS